MDAEHAAGIEDIGHIQPQVSQIVVYGLLNFLGLKRRQPTAVRIAARTSLGRDCEFVGIEKQRFANEAIGHMRSCQTHVLHARRRVPLPDPLPDQKCLGLPIA